MYPLSKTKPPKGYLDVHQTCAQLRISAYELANLVWQGKLTMDDSSERCFYLQSDVEALAKGELLGRKTK